MLVLSRRKGESVVIDQDIRITFLDIVGDVVHVEITSQKGTIAKWEERVEILKEDQEVGNG